VSQAEHDGCGQGDGREEDLRASVVRDCDAAPVLRAPEHDLDPVAALVLLGGFAARLSTGDAGLYPLVFQRISEPVGIMAPVGLQPFGFWQAARQCRRSGVIADLALSHTEAVRAALDVGDGM
jgi:hypothetical protein